MIYIPITDSILICVCIEGVLTCALQTMVCERRWKDEKKKAKEIVDGVKGNSKIASFDHLFEICERLKVVPSVSVTVHLHSEDGNASAITLSGNP